MIDKNEIDLSQFYGTEQWYRHPLFRDILYTDGVKYVAEQCEAYWLLDEIAAITTTLSKQESFLVFKLEVANEEGLLTITDGNEVFLKQETYAYTDFPLDEIKIWSANKTIMLPSEY